MSRSKKTYGEAEAKAGLFAGISAMQSKGNKMDFREANAIARCVAELNGISSEKRAWIQLLEKNPKAAKLLPFAV